MKRTFIYKAILLIALISFTTYYISYSQISAGPDVSICSDCYTMQAEEPPAGFTGTWLLLSGSGLIQNNLHNTQVCNLGFGINTFRWVVTDGIITYFDDVAISNLSVTEANAGADQTICENNTVLSGNIPLNGIGSWSILAGSGVIQNQHSPISNITDIASGINILLWKISNQQCSSIDTVYILNAGLSVSVGPDLFVCDNNVTLIGTLPNNASGCWNILDGAGIIHSPNQYLTQVSNLSLGENTFVWNVANGICSAYDIITVTNQFVEAEAGSDILTNENSITLSADAVHVGCTGQWSIIAGSGVILEPINPNSLVTNLGLGVTILRWNVYSDVCSNTDDIAITYSPDIINAGEDQFVCSNTTQLNATSVSGATNWWQVVSSTGQIVFEDINSPNSHVYGLGMGENILIWIVNNNGVIEQDTVAIYNFSVSAMSGLDQFTCENHAVLVANVTASNSGMWSLTAGSGIILTPTLFLTEVVGLSIGVNVFRWTVSNDYCSDYDDIVVTYQGVFAGNDQYITQNHTELFGIVNEGANCSWSILSGSGVFVTPNNSNTQVTSISSNQNTYILSTDCNISDTINIFYNPDSISFSFGHPVIVHGGGITGQFKNKNSDFKILIPIKVKDFVDISAFQYSINWDSSILQLDSIVNFGLTGLSYENFGSISTSTLTISWTSPINDCQTLADDSTIYMLQFTPIGLIGQTAELEINGNPTSFVAYNCNMDVVTISTSIGLVEIPQIVSGKVTYYTNMLSIKDMQVVFNNDYSKISPIDSVGNFVMFTTMKNFTIAPEKNSDLILTSGVTSQDLFLIQRHILNIELFDDPYKIIAADVDENQTVDAGDLFRIQQFIINQNLNFYPNGLWQFINSDNTFPNLQQPFPFDQNRVFDEFSAVFDNQNFIACKFGDVNHSWNSEPEKMKSSITLTLAEPQYLPNSLVIVPVKVTGFNDIGFLQFGLSWNSGNLQYVGSDNFSINSFSCLDIGTTRVNQGKLNISWYSKSGQGVNLSDNSNLFNLIFTATSSLPTSIDFSNTTSDIESGNENGLIEVITESNAVITGYSKSINSSRPIIYPNPATDALFLSNISEVRKITVINSMGISLLTYSILNKYSFQIDLTGLTPGIYFIALYNEKGDCELHKIMKK